MLHVDAASLFAPMASLSIYPNIQTALRSPLPLSPVSVLDDLEVEVGGQRCRRLRAELDYNGTWHIWAWVFRRDDASVAVEMRTLSQAFEEVFTACEKIPASFRWVDARGSSEASPLDRWLGRVMSPDDRAEWRTKPLPERLALRAESERRFHEATRQSASPDWHTKATRSFYLISHAKAAVDERFLRVLDTLWDFLDARFATLSSDVVRRPVLRVCANLAECDALRHEPSWSGAYREIAVCTVYDDRAFEDQYGDAMADLCKYYIAEKDPYLGFYLPLLVEKGLSKGLRGVRVKGKTVTFVMPWWERDFHANAVKDGTRQSLRTLLTMDAEEADALYRTVPYLDYQCAQALRFLFGPAQHIRGLEEFLPRLLHEVLVEYGGLSKAKTMEEFQRAVREAHKRAYQRLLGPLDKSWPVIEKAFSDFCRV